jgi:hypothetical protein
LAAVQIFTAQNNFLYVFNLAASPRDLAARRTPNFSLTCFSDTFLLFNLDLVTQRKCGGTVRASLQPLVFKLFHSGHAIAKFMMVPEPKSGLKDKFYLKEKEMCGKRAYLLASK